MRMTEAIRMGTALALLLLAAPTRPDEIKDAKSHYKHGTAAYALGKYSEAAAEYEKAFELAPDSALLYNAAQAHRLAGNKQRALELYQSYLRLYGSEVGNRAEVERHIAELKQAIEVDEKTKSSPPMTTAPVSPAPATTTTAPAPATTTAAPAPATTTAAPASASAAVVASAPERKRPLAKNPWLWVGLGAGAVVVAGVAIGLGVAFGKGDPRPTFGQVAY